VVAFLDTNILIYAVDTSDAVKQPKAVALVQRLLTEPAPVCISTQVAIEYLRWVRKHAPDADKAATLLDLLTPFRCQSTSITLIRSAWTLAEAHTLSWFDALIVQAAIDARCDTLYSEDLQHGRKFGGLEVVNPFVQR
jgi:predicted nucleic acid-binding protein